MSTLARSSKGTPKRYALAYPRKIPRRVPPIFGPPPTKKPVGGVDEGASLLRMDGLAATLSKTATGPKP
eukprot:379485-Pyramimonas_sp.AAC.2